MFDPDWKRQCAGKLVSAAEAVRPIARGQRIFVGSGCAEPQLLVHALTNRSAELADVEICHILTVGTAPYAAPEHRDSFRHNAFFIGHNVRGAVGEGRADFIPIFLGEVPGLFYSGRLPVDFAMIQVSPPDEHGYCSYGVSVDVVKAGAECARHVIAEINPNMPRTLGDSFIHISRIDAAVESTGPILELKQGDADDPISLKIGSYIADLIEDGSTLQLGIGAIPDAVLTGLGDRRDLGIHTEMFSDGVIPLVEKGVITGARKNIHRGKIVASFVMGNRRLYDFIDNNPLVEFHPSDYTNDPFRIAQHDRMVSINSALQVDLTGQVCADSIGPKFYSGIGGQVDFIRGASRSHRGKPIIALPSTAKDGTLSRISSVLTPGAGVVTSRGDVHYVVTEWGVAELYGKNVRQRALALIHIAHPDFREKLMEEAFNRNLIPERRVAVLRHGDPDVDRIVHHYTTPQREDVLIRPVRPTDDELIRELFYRLSPEAVYHRFFHDLKRMPHQLLAELADVNYTSQVGMVATVREGEREVIIGVGRYGLDLATKAAELAFTCRDDWQRKGIGTELFRSLIEFGRKHGVSSFIADVLPDNLAMMRLVNKCAGGPVKTERRDGLLRLTFEAQASPVASHIRRVDGGRRALSPADDMPAAPASVH